MTQEILLCEDCDQRFTTGAYIRHTRYGRCLTPDELADRKSLTLREDGVWRRAGVFPWIAQEAAARQTSRRFRVPTSWATRAARRASLRPSEAQDALPFPGGDAA